LDLKSGLLAFYVESRTTSRSSTALRVPCAGDDANFGPDKAVEDA